jgi:hypothetical protein
MRRETAQEFVPVADVRNMTTDTKYCTECKGGELDGEDEGNFHDCPEGCTEAGNDSCTGCAGKGYIAPPVKCPCDEGETQ